jgi:transcriptional regulator with XRE-family HTH domain
MTESMDLNGREEALNTYLQRLRRESGLSLAQVCERTKIQERYVQALEEGRFGELPSNTHLRAFSLALTHAEGGDSEHAALLVRRVLNAVAAPGAATIVSASPERTAPTPKAARPLPVTAEPRGLRPVAAAVALPQREAVAEAAQAAEGLLQGASQRLRALPWQALLVLVGGAVFLSGGLLWGVHLWQQRAVAAPQAGAEAPAAAGVAAASPAPATAAVVGAPDAPAPAAPVAATSLILRARRPCWLVLEIDGQRLPTITMQDGDKRAWPVTQRAVLLAGNIGALRVWWRGDNLGYLGELGSRANGMVFEPGHAFRTDKAAKLALPAGVPE